MSGRVPTLITRAAALAAAAMMAGAPAVFAAADGISPSAAPGVGPRIEWSMPERFGVDLDLDGLVDLPNSEAYVHGARAGECDPGCPDPVFPVLLRARLGDSVPAGALPLVEYRWEIEPATGPAVTATRHVPEALVRLPEGPARVTLHIVVGAPFHSLSFTASERIVVDDLLVVAIGDSYASGEGNPERHRGENGGIPAWADGVAGAEAEDDHAAARRSTVAWAAQVALDLERADPHTSVTFVSVAASGATIAHGLLGPQSAGLPLAQVPRVAALVGERSIDLLLVSVGGNDVGFSRLIAGLVDADPWLDPICYENDLENVWASVADGRWNRSSHLSWSIRRPFQIRCRTAEGGGGAAVAGMDRLPAEFDRLAAEVDRLLDPERVAVVEYPDPTGYSDGATTTVCDEIVGDAAPLGMHEIDRDEQLLGRAKVLDPLNRVIREAAERHGWDYIGGVAEAFTAGHGYCAPWPDYRSGRADPGGIGRRPGEPAVWYRNGKLAGTARLEGPVSWYRTAGQSVVLQGPDSRVDTTGTMHPNELGHRAIADLVLAALRHR